MTLHRKPRIGDRIGFGVFAGPGNGTVANVKEADKPRFTVTRVGSAGSSDENLCWILEDGMANEPKNSLPFIWNFKEGRNRLAKIFEKDDGIDRSQYVYEGPNGTGRSSDDYSPNERLKQSLGDKLK